MAESDQDDFVRERVRKELRRSRDLDWSDVDVYVSGGIVTLRGAVNDAEERAHASRIAASQRAVRGVLNQLTIKPDWGEEAQARSEFATKADADAETATQFKTRDAL